MEKIHLVSANLKTGWSVNFPIHETCNPTSVCMVLCYAKKGRLAMPNSLCRQGNVFEVFQNEDPHAIAKAIANGYRKKKLTFLRWCGVGDLTPQICKVLNILGTEYPDTLHWVVTRKPDMVKLLATDMPNVYLQFSLDSSPESVERKKEVDAINHPRLYYSFLRFEEDEDTMGAGIIFNAQQKKGTLSYNPRCCPADAKRLKVEGACAKCRKCFNPRLYK